MAKYKNKDGYILFEYPGVLNLIEEKERLAYGDSLYCENPYGVIADLVDLYGRLYGVEIPLPAMRHGVKMKKYAGRYYWGKSEVVWRDKYPTLGTLMHETAHHITTKKNGIPTNVYPHHGSLFAKELDAMADVGWTLGYLNPKESYLLHVAPL